VRVLLSTDGGRGDEPLVGPDVPLRAPGADVRVCAPPDGQGKAARDEDVPNTRIDAARDAGASTGHG